MGRQVSRTHETKAQTSSSISTARCVECIGLRGARGCSNHAFGLAQFWSNKDFGMSWCGLLIFIAQNSDTTINCQHDLRPQRSHCFYSYGHRYCRHCHCYYIALTPLSILNHYFPIINLTVTITISVELGGSRAVELHRGTSSLTDGG